MPYYGYSKLSANHVVLAVLTTIFQILPILEKINGNTEIVSWWELFLLSVGHFGAIT